MKQIDECLDRVFAGKQPLKKKWKAFIEWNHQSQRYYLYLFHYHHLVLVYNIVDKKTVHEWHERPADRRGLNAALAYLKNYDPAKHEAI